VWAELDGGTAVARLGCRGGAAAATASVGEGSVAETSENEVRE
jgi:hypothetical protein